MSSSLLNLNAVTVALITLSLSLKGSTAFYPCTFGSEQCDCYQFLYNKKQEPFISCTSESEQLNELSLILGQLNVSSKYWVKYINKNIPTISEIQNVKPIHIIEFVLSNNQISWIDSNAFSGTRFIGRLVLNTNKLATLEFLYSSWGCSIEQLSVTYNQIAFIKHSWFKCLENLTSLNLGYNSIKSIEKDSLVGVFNLDDVELAGNRIRVIESMAFCNQSEIEELSITSQNIEKLDSFTFSGLDSLNTLDLSSNLIESIADYAFYGLSNLQKLTLSNNFLYSIEQYAFDHSLAESLVKMYLTYNYLEALGYDTFYHLKKLKILFIDQNNIQTVDSFAFVSQANTLLTLNISYNRLSSIRKHHFSYLQALQKLSLVRNQISTIEPGSFYNMRSLVELDLSNNCLFYLESSLFNTLTNMISLNLNANVIVHLDVNIFSSQQKLTKLDLSHNTLVEIEPLTFNNLSSLSFLNLSQNMISTIDSEQIFIGLSSLQILDLSNNIIQTLTTDSLSVLNQQTIKQLYLGSNLIDSSRSPIEFNFKYLSVLDLSSNKELFISSSAKFISTESDQIYLSFRSMSSRFIQNLSDYLREDTVIASQIAQLDLSENDLEALFDQFPFAKLTGLMNLYLRNANIKSSVATLNELSNLIELDLSDNPLLVFEPILVPNAQLLGKLVLSNTGLHNLTGTIDFSLLPGLFHLDLSRNNLKTIDSSVIESCIYIDRWNLSHNSIETLDLPSLYIANTGLVLDVSYNLLQSLYVSNQFLIMGPDIQMKILINNNRLTSFDSNINLISAISLQNNMFDEIPACILSNADYIDTLNMNSNNLSTIVDGLFDVFKALKYLSLANNLIKNIPDQSFYKLYLLEKLDLSCNLLVDINSDTFVGLNSLIYLNLSFNLIEHFASPTFQSMMNLRTLDLNGNQIRIIQDFSFSSLVYTTTLNINKIDRMNFTVNTFVGLKRIKRLELNMAQFDDYTNSINLIETLQVDRWVQHRLYTYYESINVICALGQMNKQYCLRVLYFARYNILFNLQSDSMVEDFIDVCKIFSFI